MKIRINSLDTSACFNVSYLYPVSYSLVEVVFSFFSLSSFRIVKIIPKEPKIIQMIKRKLIALGTLSDTFDGKKSSAPILSGLIILKAIFCVMTAPVVKPQKYIPVPRPFLFSNHSQTITSVADKISPDPRQETNAYQNRNHLKLSHK